MSNCKPRDLALQFAGKAWSMLMALAFLPSYIEILGPEKFAIVGFYFVSQAVVSLLDTAITATVSREITKARLHSSDQLATSIRTLELLVYPTALAVLVVGGFCSPVLSELLQTRSGLDHRECRADALLITCAVATQGIYLFYLSSILALKKHLIYSGVRSLWFTGRFAGGFVCLTVIAPNPSVFLACHCVTTMVLAAFLRQIIWHSIPRPSKVFAFETKVVSENFQFITNTIGITATTIALCQVDKIILFKIVDTTDYTFYIAVWTLAGGLRQVAEPLFVYLLPGFTERLGVGATLSTRKEFTSGMRAAVVLVLPLAFTAMFFPGEILSQWVRGIALQWKHLITYEFLIAGMALNALALVPFALQLAKGDTAQLLGTNMLLAGLCLPGLIILHLDNGVVVAGAVWLSVNTVYTIFTTPQTYRRVFKEPYAPWFGRNIMLPSFVCFVVAATTKEVTGLVGVPEGFGVLLCLFLNWMCGFVVTVLCFPEVARRVTNALPFSAIKSQAA